MRAVELGSTNEESMEVAKRIANLVEELNLSLKVVWRRSNTEEIRLCDRLSKEFDLSEYRVKQRDFAKLEAFYMDWFASSWSKRKLPFASKYLDRGAR